MIDVRFRSFCLLSFLLMLSLNVPAAAAPPKAKPAPSRPAKRTTRPAKRHSATRQPRTVPASAPDEDRD